MSQGSLLFNLRQPFFHPTTGELVVNGKLRFHRTGTTTDQDTYSDSTLDTANANPVILSAVGTLATKVYGDPSTGFDYRVRLYDENDVLLWTEDDVVVDGADTATYAEGSFTGTLTGFATANPTGTVNYRITQNSAGTGKICRLYISSTITGTSNATTMTMTGLPAAVSPSVAVRALCELTDATTGFVIALAIIAASGTTITFAVDQPFNASGFTNTGTKELPAGWNISYPL